MTSMQMVSQSAHSGAENAFAPRLLPADGSGPENLETHLERHGTCSRNHTSNEWRDTVLQEIECAGLLGRGGAGFPTVQKLRAVLAGEREPPVIGNGIRRE